jgi:carboxyl-terminal processing protease
MQLNTRRKGLIVAALASVMLAFTSFDNKYFEIAKNLEIFANAYREINHAYVDELDPGAVMRRGMDAMLEGLDPFTNYISETDIEGYRYQNEGRYNGFGGEVKKMGEWVTLTDIYEDSPAHKAGLKVGDQIVAIENQTAQGRNEVQVTEFLRGFPGTEVALTIRRPGETKDLKISVKRDEVNIPNVPHYGIVDKNIGYVNLTVFTRDASANVSNAIRVLRAQDPELKGLVLDLRDNGGGLLNEAVSLVNLFVPRGEIIVTTKGKVPEWNRDFRTTAMPIAEDLPVVVLIDKMSASASEIVSGSLQDLDRAVLMGQLSYGKGLVQNTKDLGFNAKVKLTTAKYYIPSGRCIQAVRYKNGVPVHIADSERAQFRTRSGRIVLDGGGVKPDVDLPADTATGIVRALLSQHVIFDYVTDYARRMPKIDSIETFAYNDWDDFMRFVQSRNFSYESASEQKLRELREASVRDNYTLGAEINGLEQKIKAAKTGELAKNKARIVREIEQDIIGRSFFQRGKVRKRLKNDPEVEQAVQLLNDPVRYKKILTTK